MTEIERIEFTVAAGASVTKTHRTKNGNKRITGVCLISHSGDSAVIGTTMKMTIDRRQVFPADFNPSVLAFSQQTGVNDRWHDYIDQPIDQSDIVIDFTDAAAGAGGTFVLLLKCAS